MADQTVLDKYEMTIGIECHVQLKTQTKLFARVSNDAREAEPNTTVSPICFGLPGVLPYLNEQAVELAVRAGLALNATINPHSTFDRKHYFYPDLPKGYQITQYAQPIVGEGYVEVPVGEETVRVGIERAHLEEDAGKLTHPGNADYSLVDLNRAGTPLLEIVSKPDIHSPTAAKAYARELYLLMKYSDVSDVDLYHGHMRFDVNISVAAKGSDELGTRAEVKNLNSFRAVEKAAEYEFNRQAELLEKGEQVVQETRGWNEDKSQTFSQRSKEEAHDYRYFPEPDLPPVEVADDMKEKTRMSLPALPSGWRAKLADLDLESSQIETLIEGEVEISEVSFLPLIENNIGDKDKAKFLANWSVNVMIPMVKEGKFKFRQDEHLRLEIDIYELVKANKLSSTSAKALFAEIIESGSLPEDLEKYAQDKGYVQVSDEGEITRIVEEVIANNPKAAEDVRNGEAKAIGFLVGQVMNLSKAQANPKMAQDLIKKQLGQK